MDLPMNIKVNYIERRSDDLKACQKALRAEEYELIEKTGHQIKGSAETFGYRELGVIGQNLEKAAQTKSLKQAEYILTKLEKWLKNELN